MKRNKPYESPQVKVTKLHGDWIKTLTLINGKRWTNYREKWEATNRFEYLPDWPLQVTVEPIFRCNARCVMCLHTLPLKEKEKWGDVTASLPTSKIMEIIDEGKGRMHAFIPHGIGEPLLYRDLAKVCEHAYETGTVDIYLSSNAALLDYKTREKVRMIPLTRIEFSLDAFTKETYEKVRMGLDFEDVKEHILAFMDVRMHNRCGMALPLVRVSFCKNPINIHEWETFKTYWEGKVDYIAEQNCALFDTQSNPFDKSPSGHCNDLQTFRCPSPFQQIMVRSDGGVIPCCGFGYPDGSLLMGNVHHNSVEEIWHSQRFKDFRELHLAGRWRDNPGCKNCVEGSVKWD